MNQIIAFITTLPYTDALIVAVMAWKFITFSGAALICLRIAFIKAAPTTVYALYGLGFLAFLYTFYQSFTLLPVVLHIFHGFEFDLVLRNQLAQVIGCTAFFAASVIKYTKLRRMKLV